jgi:hypothetical protein
MRGVVAASVALGAAGVALLSLDLGVGASAAGFAMTGVAGVALVSAAFYAVGAGEDRARAEEARARARAARPAPRRLRLPPRRRR